MEGRRFWFERNPPLPPKSSSGAGDSGSGLEREGRVESIDQLPQRDDPVLHLLTDLRTFLTRHEETTKEALKEYREELSEVKSLLAGHNVILNALVANSGMGVVPKPVGKHVGEERTSVAEHGDVSPAAVPDTTLKWKLDFTTDDSIVEDLFEVRQEGPGSPFTFHSHVNPIVYANELPKCFDLEFPAPDGFEFAGMELAVAALIFGKDLDEGEVLVTRVHDIGDRRTLKSLCPGKQLYDDVILLKTNLDYDPKALAEIKEHYIGRADDIFKAYVPLHKDNHWYLMIVHFHDNELVYLDSAQVDSETVARKAQMRIVVVNAGTRMRLAIDLVMGIHNPLRHDMTRIAVEEWDKKCRKAVRRSKKKDARI
ncbi:hypothetical protein PIB30_021746 [Stylosanthes scabra]|uniref:Ubiquitin-like protease family profile domain-containing protein n=1 Tax=Stylosanthes scabra TaxID=79078 RepID=A0ABU6T8P9_9FABA|nr:hypothetical protein [Stylosanthes scabra]